MKSPSMRRPFRATLAACCLVLLCAGARAQFTLNDLQIAGRALGFLEKPLSGDVKAGIVYAPDDPRSVAEADALKDLLGQGLRVGNVRLVPVLVPVAACRPAQQATVQRCLCRLYFSNRRWPSKGNP